MAAKKKKKKTTTKRAVTKKTYKIMSDTIVSSDEAANAAAPATGPEVFPLPLAVIPPMTGSTVQEGTAQVEPQFVVTRYGHKFVTAQTFKDLHKGLLQAEELEEQIVEIDFSMEGYPLDCIVQVNRAINLVYGFSHAKERMTFFGPIPPKRLNIKTSLTESVQVVYGEMAPPAWEGGSIDMNVDMANPLSLSVTGQIKRKFEPAIKGIVKMAENLLKEKSIYRGNAVELDLNYIVTGEFNPAHCAPKFIDVSQKVTLILPRDIEFELETNVWNIMREPEYFRMNGIPIKSGVQLDGGPGTGKTLTAYRTAQEAIESKWTYIYLRTPLTAKTFLTGYRLAQLYGPSIFFVEDNDVLFGKQRDEEMNSLLETLDGITAKNAEVITIFTTNYPERLNEAFTRSGRVNHQISFRAPDAEAAGRFVKQMAGEFLHPDVDIEKVGEAFANLVPADIQNGIDQAKKNCIGVSGREVKGFDGLIINRLTTDQLVTAAEVVQRKARRNVGQEDKNAMQLKKIHEGFGAVMGTVGEDVQLVNKRVEKIESDLKKVAAGVNVKLK